MSERDSKRIAREWNREIEDEIRRAAHKPEGGWRSVVWAVLWVLWIAALVGAIGLVRRLQW